MKRLILILSLFTLSCNYPNNNKAVLQIISSKSKDTLKTSDTLRDPNSYSFLTNLPIRQVANLILIDSIKPSDNKVTFDCMDSIHSSNIDSRNFYFPVFLKIVDKADGALAETVGEPLQIYVEKFPKEFIERANNLSDEQLQSLASFIGFELYNDYDTEKGDIEWRDKILKKCSDCNSIQLHKLKQFIELVIAARIRIGNSQ